MLSSAQRAWSHDSIETNGMSNSLSRNRLIQFFLAFKVLTMEFNGDYHLWNFSRLGGALQLKADADIIDILYTCVVSNRRDLTKNILLNFYLECNFLPYFVG